MAYRYFVCPGCGQVHPRLSLALGCCSRGSELSPEELEIIGQLRLFDDAMPLEGARIPVELDGGGPQLKLF